MAHLTLGETQVESEREVVANERRFRVEDDVDGFLNEELYKAAFTTHPYHWPTIGWMRDIEAISIDDCRAFYRTYYAPNNATVVLVGDVDEESALALIERALRQDSVVADPGRSRRGRAGADGRAARDLDQAGDRRQAAHRLQGAADRPRRLRGARGARSEILFGGNSSRLHRKLVVDTEIASSAHASTAPFRDPGLYEIAVSAAARARRGRGGGDRLRRARRAGRRGRSTPHELDTAKTRLLTHFWRELRPQAGKAEALGHYETTVGDYRKLFAVADGYSSGDRGRRRARGRRRTCGPSGAPSSIATPSEKSVVSATRVEGPRRIARSSSRRTTICRSCACRSRCASAPATTRPSRRPRPTSPPSSWARGAGGRTRAEIDAAFDALGTSLDVVSDYDGVTFEVDGAEGEARAGAGARSPTCSCVPTFPRGEADKLKRELRGAARRAARRRRLARAPLLHARALRRASLRAHRHRHRGVDRRRSSLDERARLAPARARRRQHDLRRRRRRRRAATRRAAIARHFGALPSGGGEPGARPSGAARRRGMRLTLVDKPERTQSQILMGQPAPRWHDPDFLALQVGDHRVRRHLHRAPDGRGALQARPVVRRLGARSARGAAPRRWWRTCSRRWSRRRRRSSWCSRLWREWVDRRRHRARGRVRARLSRQELRLQRRHARGSPRAAHRARARRACRATSPTPSPRACRRSSAPTRCARSPRI